MKKILLPVLFGPAIAMALTGCASTNSTRSAQGEPPKFSHLRDITNPYLPLASLKQDVLESKSSRVKRTAKPDVHKTFQFGGQTIEAFTVEDREFDPQGNLTEATLDYFAQDDDGNVCYLGEDVDEYRNGHITGHSGAWLLGKDTQKPGVIMLAHLNVGDKFNAEDVPHIIREADEVVSISESAIVPAGTFQKCVKIREAASDGDTEYKLYAPGIGCVAEIEGSNPLRLKSHETK